METARGKTWFQEKNRIRTLEPERKLQNRGSAINNRFMEASSIRAVEGEGNERKFTLSFSSEEPCRNWFGVEILDHSEGCADLTRLKSIGCVLYNHDRDKVVGKINRAWIDGNRGYAEIEFDTDEESEKIFQKVKNKTLKGVSVGYRVDTYETVNLGLISLDGRFKGPCKIAKRWMPVEISIVSVPADPTVGVGRELDHGAAVAPALDIYERQLQINKNYL